MCLAADLCTFKYRGPYTLPHAKLFPLVALENTDQSGKLYLQIEMKIIDLST
jgi:hypothetical protein